MKQVPIEEYRRRTQKLHNFEKILYPQLKRRSDKLRKENKELKEKISNFTNIEKDKDKEIEKLKLELEELRVSKFGKKRQQNKKEKVPLSSKDSNKGLQPKKERLPDSYRRKEPEQSKITGEIKIEIDECPKCGAGLIKKEEYVYYREDLEELTTLYENAKKITRRIIESGYCPNCKKRKTDVNIPKQKVEIGLNVKMMIAYYHVILGLSHQEIQDHLKNCYDIKISDGQITNSLEEQADILRPYYNEIFEELQEEAGAHYDETSWKVQKEGEGNYAWVKTGATSNKVMFWFGRSRGKGVAEKLRGNFSKKSVKEQIGISDDYGSYTNLFAQGNHQLCWAHPHRKLRDLAESRTLVKTKQKHCQTVYKDFAKLYKESEQAKEKFNSGEYKDEAEKQADESRLKKWFKRIMVPHKNDPKKLETIKLSLSVRLDRYFTFLKVPGIPLDNNKAERCVRKVVLKRKKSFGCKTQKGANTLSILYSVCFTILWTYPPEEFLERYQEVMGI